MCLSAGKSESESDVRVSFAGDDGEAGAKQARPLQESQLLARCAGITFERGGCRCIRYSLPKRDSSQARSASSARSMPLRGSAAPLLEPQNERRVERTVEAVL